MPVKGETTLYRPPPHDFEQTFVRVGWTEVCEETRAHSKTVKKWLVMINKQRALTGLPTLEQERRRHVLRYGPAKSPGRVALRMRTVRNRQRLSAVTPSDLTE